MREAWTSAVKVGDHVSNQRNTSHAATAENVQTPNETFTLGIHTSLLQNRGGLRQNSSSWCRKHSLEFLNRGPPNSIQIPANLRK